MARAQPATPTRRVTRSSSRTRPADDSDDDEKAQVSRRRASKSPSKQKKDKETPKKEATRGRSASGKRSYNRKSDKSNDEEVKDTKKSPKKVSKSPAKDKVAKPNGNRRSISRGRKAAESDDEESPKRSASAKNNGKDAANKKPTKEKASENVEKVEKKPVRVRSRSRGRKTDDDDDDDEDDKKKSPKAQASPTSRKSRQFVSSELDSDDEPVSVMYRHKTPTIVVKSIDFVWLVLIGFIPLFTVLLNMWHVSPIIRDVIANRFPKLALINNFAGLPLWQILTVNLFLYLVTAILIAFKLRKSNASSFVTSTITSMIFRLYVCGSICLAWCFLYFVKRHIAEFILPIISISLLASSAADLFYSFGTSSGARLLENLLNISISYFVLFQMPFSTNEVVKQLAAPLLSTLILYSIVAILIAIGSVGVLSTSNTTHTSQTITAVSHACIWLHTIVAIVGPVAVFFLEVQKHLTTQFSKPAITARAIAVGASVLLNFASYADAVTVDIKGNKN
jgi:hypothetical protein